MQKRNTIQKDLVLQTVHFMKNHVTADEVYAEVIKKYPNISKATVYRNLKQLAQDGKIKKVEIPNAADYFDHILCKHYHAKCEVCGKILDVKMNYITQLEANIENTDDFVFSGHDIIFKGVCKKCQEAQN